MVNTVEATAGQDAALYNTLEIKAYALTLAGSRGYFNSSVIHKLVVNAGF